MTEEAVYRMEGTKVSATRSSTAIVKRFQTEKKNLKLIRVTGSPFR